MNFQSIISVGRGHEREAKRKFLEFLELNFDVSISAEIEHKSVSLGMYDWEKGKNIFSSLPIPVMK